MEITDARPVIDPFVSSFQHLFLLFVGILSYFSVCICFSFVCVGKEAKA